MKIPQIAIFITIVLSIYFLVNSFIYVQTKPVFSIATFGIWLKVAFWLLVLSYPLGRVLEGIFDGNIFSILVKIGSIWLGAMLYLFIIFLILLIVRFSNNLFNYSEYLDFKSHLNYKQIAVFVVYTITTLVLIAGHINAINPKVSKVNIKTNKISDDNGLRIVAVSDIHLGTIIGKKRLSKLVNLINEQKPDIVLLAGDIFDEDIAPVVNGGMGKLFEDINSKYGIYAVTGNHEYFGNFEAKIAYLKQHKVNVLRDSSALIDNFYVIGRDDRQSNAALKRNRKTIEELVNGLDKSKFMILLDHQPYHLNEAQENGIDLQLSGHTHDGQMWPFNYATQGIFEVSKGYLKKGNTHYYVSTGFGTWGPRVRIGNRPEIVVIDLNH
ncbi:MAG: metallophosphoesterase [Bacteroidales bacterium]